MGRNFFQSADAVVFAEVVLQAGWKLADPTSVRASSMVRNPYQTGEETDGELYQNDIKVNIATPQALLFHRPTFSTADSSPACMPERYLGAKNGLPVPRQYGSDCEWRATTYVLLIAAVSSSHLIQANKVVCNDVGWVVGNTNLLSCNRVTALRDSRRGIIHSVSVPSAHFVCRGKWEPNDQSWSAVVLVNDM